MPANIELKNRLYALLKKEFPDDTVDVSDGYADNIHVLVVSRRFDGMKENEKIEMLWKYIENSDLPDEEKMRISLIVPYTPAELK